MQIKRPHAHIHTYSVALHLVIKETLPPLIKAFSCTLGLQCARLSVCVCTYFFFFFKKAHLTSLNFHLLHFLVCVVCNSCHQDSTAQSTMARSQWNPYCTLHTHTNKDQSWTCDHILGKQLFRFLYDETECRELKSLWDSPHNKQDLPPHANTFAGLLCQRAWLWLDREKTGENGRSLECCCLDCVLARLRRGKGLSRNLRQGLQFLENPEDSSLSCYKASLCRSLRDLQRHYPQHEKELRRIRKRVRPLVCCRHRVYPTVCPRCALHRPPSPASYLNRKKV